MSQDNFIETFTTEADDHIEALNEHVLILEKNPEESDSIDRMFRAFHTLKGNGATLGFENFSKIAHRLEDLLDAVRNHKITIDDDVVDLLLEGIDLLQEGLDVIKETQKDDIDGDAIIEKVNSYLNDQKDQVVIAEFQEEFPYTESEKKELEKQKKTKKNIYRILLLFEQNNPLKLAKVKLINAKLLKTATVIATQPANIKAGIKNIADFIVVTKDSKEDVEKTITSISGTLFSWVGEYDESIPQKLKDLRKEETKQQVVKKHNTGAVEKTQFVKIDLKRLDKLLNLVGELLISKMRLETLTSRYSDKELSATTSVIDRLVRDIQDEVMSQRMIPIGQIFNRFPRMIRDLAKHEDKDVELVIEGSDIEFDRTVLDLIGDPLVHLLRNAVDHGIEKPNERIEDGKEPKGVVKLIAERQKTKAVIRVIDDGAGIDGEKVKAAAVKKGIITQEDAESMTENESQMLIFRPKVSTNEVITDVSGRGVGMDVVLSNVQKAGGTVRLSSELHKGSEVMMHLPLTVAIETVLMVVIENCKFAIPVSSITRIITVGSEDVKKMGGKAVYLLNKKPLDLLYMDKLFQPKQLTQKHATTIVVESDGKELGLIVDSIVRQEQILIKSLDDERLKGMRGVSGAAILGDGSVALVLDINSLVNKDGR